MLPNRSTLTRFPCELKVDTSSGMPKNLSVTVTLPSAFTVSTPPNKKSKNASRGGTFKDGGRGGGDGGLYEFGRSINFVTPSSE
jgi:hypothetical protein